MDIDRKQIMAAFLRTLDHISDKNYQRRIWIMAEGPECDSFDDVVCDYLHEGDGILEKYKEFGITENQYHLLKKFHENFEKFAADNDFPQFFIDSPGWKKIMDEAKEVLAAFDYQMPDKFSTGFINDKMMTIDRKQIMASFLETLADISDKNYQRRIWIMAEGPECDSFDDAVCNYLYEGDGILDKYKEFGITEHQYQLLKKFHVLFRNFAKDHDLPQLFIDTPEWKKIMDEAKVILAAFNYQKPDQSNSGNSYIIS